MELQRQIGREHQSRGLSTEFGSVVLPQTTLIPPGKKLRGLICDSDGTLVDTLPMIRMGQFEAVRSYLEIHHRDLPLPEYHRYEEALKVSIGGSTLDTFRRTLTVLYGPGVVQGINVTALDSTLKDVQDRIAPDHIKAYPGLPTLLQALGKEGIPLAILTSGSRYHIIRNYGIALRPELGSFLARAHQREGVDDLTKLKELLAAIKQVFNVDVTFITCDDVRNTKPDPEGIFEAFRRFGFDQRDLEEVVMVGDHHVDILAGQAAGVRTVGVVHGFGTAQELHRAGATMLCKNLMTTQMALGL